MRKLINKSLAVFLVAVMLFVALTATPFAASTVETSQSVGASSGTTGACTWMLDENGTLTISGIGEMKDYVNYNDQVPWGKIITEVVIENGVTRIGAGSFKECTDLKRVRIADSVTSIGGGAFAYCKKLPSVIIPRNVKRIEQYAFYSCTNLNNISIPANVTSIGGYAFNNTAWLNKQPDGLVVTGKVAYKFKGNTPLSIVIPNGITEVSDFAFCDCKGLTSVTFSDSVVSIGEQSFSYCTDLTNIYIGKGMISIGDSAFLQCLSLTSISIPDNVKNLGEGVFAHCRGLTSVTIGNGVMKIGDAIFYQCSKLSDVVLGSGIKRITNRMFVSCKDLTSFTIPDGVTSIGEHAFLGCSSLVNITIPRSVISIESGAFDFCDLLQDVYFTDNKPKWNQISIESENDNLKNAKFYYNYIKKNNELDFSKDVWRFKNFSDNRCYFVNDITNGVFRNPYIWQLKPSSRAIVDMAFEEGGSSGHCFGMSATVILQKLKLEDSTRWYQVDCLRSIEKDEVTKCQICYFHAMQYLWDMTEEIKKFTSYSTTDQLKILSARADMVKRGGNPILLWFEKKSGGGHAVVAYALQSGLFVSSSSGRKYDHRILLYDCNKVDWTDDTCLLFNKNTDEWEIPCNNDASSFDDTILVCAANDTSVFDGIDDLEQKNTTGVCPRIIVGTQGSGSINVIKKDTGEKWSINVKTGKVSGSTNLFCYRNLDANTQEQNDYSINVILPDDRSEYVFETDSKELSDFKISAKCPDKYFSIESESSRGVTISFDGTISVIDNEGEFKITAADDSMQQDDKYDTFSIFGKNEGNTTLSILEDGIKLCGDNIKGIKVDASNSDTFGTTTIENTSNEELSNNIDDYLTVNKFMVGDINLDGKIDVNDVTALQRHLADLSTFTDPQLALADANGDGVVDINDATHLQKYLAEYNVALGKQS